MNTLIVFRQIEEKVKVYLKQLKPKIEEKATGRPRILSITKTLYVMGLPIHKLNVFMDM